MMLMYVHTNIQRRTHNEKWRNENFSHKTQQLSFECCCIGVSMRRIQRKRDTFVRSNNGRIKLPPTFIQIGKCSSTERERALCSRERERTFHLISPCVFFFAYFSSFHFEYKIQLNLSNSEAIVLHNRKRNSSSNNNTKTHSH